jgi:hypothetical protein
LYAHTDTMTLVSNFPIDHSGNVPIMNSINYGINGLAAPGLVTVWLLTHSKSFDRDRTGSKSHSESSSSVSNSLEEFRKGQKSQYLDSKSRGTWYHGGSTPPFGTNKINYLREFRFLDGAKNGMTLPVTLPVFLNMME